MHSATTGVAFSQSNHRRGVKCRAVLCESRLVACRRVLRVRVAGINRTAAPHRGRPCVAPRKSSGAPLSKELGLAAIAEPVRTTNPREVFRGVAKPTLQRSNEAAVAHAFRCGAPCSLRGAPRRSAQVKWHMPRCAEENQPLPPVFRTIVFIHERESIVCESSQRHLVLVFT